MPMSDSPALDAALQAEYYHLQKTVEDFDARVLTVKAWSVTFGLASVVGAFASKSHIVFLLAAACATMFWFLEAHWKLFQLGYYRRIQQIEQHFQGDALERHPHQISATWQGWWQEQSWFRLFIVAKWPHVALPHAFVLLIGMLCFLTVRFG